MSAVISYNFDNMPADLMQAVNADQGLIRDVLIDGLAQIAENFTPLTTDDKAPIVLLEVADFARAADRKFDPQADVLKFSSRIAQLQDVDLDFNVSIDDLKRIYRSYLKYITSLNSEAEVMANPFRLFFLREVIRTHMAHLLKKGSWKGQKDITGIGMDKAVDGLLKKIQAAQTDGTLEADQIFPDAVPLTEENAYDEVQKYADHIREIYPDLLGTTLDIRMSKKNVKLYNRARRNKFPNHVKPGDVAVTLDDEDIVVVADEGLNDSDAIVITPRSNLFVLTNENVGAYRLKIVETVKGWDVNIRISTGFDFGVPKFLFWNGLV